MNIRTLRPIVALCAMAIIALACNQRGCQTRQSDVLDKALWYAERLVDHKGETRAQVCGENIRQAKNDAQAVLDARAEGADSGKIKLLVETADYSEVAMEASCGWLGKPQAVDMVPSPDLTKPADMQTPDLSSPSDLKPPADLKPPSADGGGHVEEHRGNGPSMLGMGYVR